MEDVFGKAERCHLSYPLKGDIAQIVEQERGKAAQHIGCDQSHCDLRCARQVFERARPLHRIDRAFIGEGKREDDRLGEQDQPHSDNNPPAKSGIIFGPQIGKKAL